MGVSAVARVPRREVPQRVRRLAGLVSRCPWTLVTLAGMSRRSHWAFVALLASALLIAGCGGSSDNAQRTSEASQAQVGDPGPIHVHGLGINPSDGALFVATHTGLFRAANGQRQAKRVADRFQDTMGFTIVGSDRFLGSGHPDLREELPPFLGLMESRDAGRTWEPVSLLGKRDFHVLEAAARWIYGYGSDFQSRKEGLLVSDDGGRRWANRTFPEAMTSLAIDPEAPSRVLASGVKALYLSSDAGGRWSGVEGEPSLLSWPAVGALFAVAEDGTVARSDEPGGQWSEVGHVGGEPAAFEAASADELYVALHDGTIKRSTDGGRSWSVRLTA